MRRKNNRSSSNSAAEKKSDSRKSTRSSKRRKSPSPELEEENANASSSSTNENPTKDQQKTIPSNLSEEILEEKNVSHELVENENTSDVNNISNSTDGGHTPPPAGSAGNEVPDIDEVDAEKEKGKSKGINCSQVEENSEIKMTNVNSDSAEGAGSSSHVNPWVNLSHSETTNDNQVIQDQNKEKCSEEIHPNVDTKNTDYDQLDHTNSLKSCENLSNSESDAKSVECSSANEGGPEKVIDTNGDVDVKKTISESETETVNVPDPDDDQAEEGEIRESKSDEENENYGNDGHLYVKAKKPAVKIKLRRDSFFEALEKFQETELPVVKKIKWNPVEHECLKPSYSNLYKLNVEDFKALSSDLKLADEKEIKLENIYKPKSGELKLVKERTISMDASSEEMEKPEYTKQSSTVSSDDQENTNIIALNRKISIVDDSASKLRPPPSPAKQPVSSILFISNLVRPFTIKQLKELLERMGTIKDDGFWTDRIKSKCYVQYDSSEEAEATRNALHGVNWPIGNGKKLIIDYGTEEEMEKARNPPPQPMAVIPSATPPRPRAKTPQKETPEPVHDSRNGDRRTERKRADSEREKERGRTTSSRKWDATKETRKERSRSRSRERRRKHSGRRSITPLEDYIARKQRKLEESIPQKLMDDLFQRTKTMPCIYWQSLSPEEISIKQQQRLSRMEEHKRRLEENSRTRGARDVGRGVYRRHFD